MQSKKFQRKGKAFITFPIILAALHAVNILILIFFTTYPKQVKVVLNAPNSISVINAHLMTFIGFGFVLAFLNKYGYSAIGTSLLIGSIALEWGAITNGFFRNLWRDEWDKTEMNLQAMMGSEYAAMAMIISLGALIGRISPMQMLTVTYIGTTLFSFNLTLNLEELKAIDANGQISIHLFAACFGFATSLIQTDKQKHQKAMSNNLYKSDKSNAALTLIGTIFLFVFWPIFNSAWYKLENQQSERIVINTVLCLASSLITIFIMSQLTRKMFSYKDIQQATISGAVIISSVTALIVNAGLSTLIGAFSGIITQLCIRWVHPLFQKHLRFYDTRGIMYTHGIPAFLGVIISMVAIIYIDEDQMHYTTPIDFILPDLLQEKREKSEQAWYQFAFMCLTILIGLIGGIICGIILKVIPKWHKNLYYNDEEEWEQTELLDFEYSINKHNVKSKMGTNSDEKISPKLN